MRDDIDDAIRADMADDANSTVMGECKEHDYQWAYRADHPRTEIGCPMCTSLELVRLRTTVGACWALRELARWETARSPMPDRLREAVEALDTDRRDEPDADGEGREGS